MKEALIEARKAYDLLEVPIGSIVFDGEKIIGRGFNQVEKKQLATAHAECVAIEEASRNLNNFRLSSCAIFSTIEPCTMCFGAIINARIPNVFFGCSEPVSGALGSKCNLSNLYPEIKIESGILEAECKDLIQRFFKMRRAK